MNNPYQQAASAVANHWVLDGLSMRFKEQEDLA